MSPQITLITPTGARPEAFDICVKLVQRQTFKQWHWVVVDDGPLPFNGCSALKSLISNGRCTYVRPIPLWTGENTHKRNLQTALAVCRTELVAFIEDDDWYHPEYLERSLNKTKEGYGLVGEANARYYHLPTCSYRMMKNRGHASLSQSLMHRSMLPCLLDILATNEDSFDILLWQASWKTGKPFLFPTSTHVVGVKGMPGRPGVGLGHRPGSNWSKDTGCDTLQQWIGPDAQLYTEYLAGALLQRLRGIL